MLNSSLVTANVAGFETRVFLSYLKVKRAVLCDISYILKGKEAFPVQSHT